MMTQKTILRGVIVVHDFDPSGNPVRFALLTDDEKKYIIAPNKKKTVIPFGNYNRKQVQLSGEKLLVENKDILLVDEIKLLKKDHDGSYFDIL